MRQSPKKTSGKRRSLRCSSAPSFGFEPLEARQLFSVTGFSLVNELNFPGSNITVSNQHNAFQSELTQSWQQLASDQMTSGGQTLSQFITSSVQAAAQQQNVTAYQINPMFSTNTTYSAYLVHENGSTISGQTPYANSNVFMTFDAIGNHVTFKTTTNSINGSGNDPIYTLSFDLNIGVDLSIPTNPVNGTVTATAAATVINVSASVGQGTSSFDVGFGDLAGVGATTVFGLLGNLADPSLAGLANGINGSQQNLANFMPTAPLNMLIRSEAAQGYTHLSTGLDGNGNLLLDALKPTISVSGSANDQINISSEPDGSIAITAAGQSQTFDPSSLGTINVYTGHGQNSVNIPSLPAGVAVNIVGSIGSNDNVTVGGSGSLANVAGTVNVQNEYGKTVLTVDDANDPGASILVITNDAVQYQGPDQFQGRDVVTYDSNDGNSEVTELVVDSGAHGGSITVDGTAAGVPTDVLTYSGKNSVFIDGTSSAVNVGSIAGTDTVTVGDGILAAIGGPVSITNGFGNTTVQINDALDPLSQNVKLTSSAVTFQGGTTIQLGTNVSSVGIATGYPGSTYDAESSPSYGYFTITGRPSISVTGPAAGEVTVNYPRVASYPTNPVIVNPIIVPIILPNGIPISTPISIPIITPIITPISTPVITPAGADSLGGTALALPALTAGGTGVIAPAAATVSVHAVSTVLSPVTTANGMVFGTAVSTSPTTVVTVPISSIGHR